MLIRDCSDASKCGMCHNSDSETLGGDRSPKCVAVTSQLPGLGHEVIKGH
jgi:hypothetical protein